MESTVRCPFTAKLIDVCCPQLSHKSSTNVFDVEPAKLARGSSGVVRTCKVKTDGAAFALKKVSLGIGAAGPTREDLLREAILWKKLNHPNIVGYYLSWEEISEFKSKEISSGSSEDEYEDECGDEHTDDHKSSERSCLFMLLELCDISLDQKLAEVVFEKRQCWEIFQEIMDALKYIHSRGILHGDLTSRNVFLKNTKVKIGDFGSARRLANRYNGGAPRPLANPEEGYYFGAPRPGVPDDCQFECGVEKPKDNVITDRFDIYCGGIVMVEMLAGDLLINDLRDGTLDKLVNDLRDDTKLVEQYPRDWDDHWKALLKKVLHRDYRLRPSANDVLKEINLIISGLERKKRKRND